MRRSSVGNPGEAGYGGAVRTMPHGERGQAEGLSAGRIRQITRAGFPARPATTHIVRRWMQEVRSESIPTSFSGILCRRRRWHGSQCWRERPEDSPNYKMSDHWWGMLIDIPKCIGCGNCVRACAAENDVPDGHFRTWVERYHVTDENMTNPEVISPDGGKEGFPVAQGGCGEVLLCSEDVQSLRGFAVHAGLPGGRDFCEPGRRGAGGSEVLPGMRVLRAGLPYGCRYIHPEKKVADKCTLCYHRITKGLTTACCETLSDRGAAACGFEESEGSDSRVPEDA